MKTKHQKNPGIKELHRKNYLAKVELAHTLSNTVEKKQFEGLGFIFPHYVYRQLVKIYR